VLKESFFEETAFFDRDPFLEMDLFSKFACIRQEPGRPLRWFPVLVFALVVAAGG
jgi:hypothetical protein